MKINFLFLALSIFFITALLSTWASKKITHNKKITKLTLFLNIITFILLTLTLKLDLPNNIEQISTLLVIIFFTSELLTLIFLAIYIFFHSIWQKLQKQQKAPLDLKKRSTLQASLFLPTIALTGSLYGSFYERKKLAIHNMHIIIHQKKKLDGFKITQLSDIHLGPFFSLKDLDKLLARSVKENPSLLVITGDLFDDDKLNEKAAHIVDSYTDKFPYGIIFIYGNHEYFHNIQAINEALKKTKICILKNENIKLIGGKTPLYIAGVDYPMDRENFVALEKAYAKKAFLGIPKNATTILLAHHPDFIDDGRHYGARLVLTGHTHGGQFGFLGVPLVPPIYKYMRGRYDLSSHTGTTTGYVHTGNGSWFPLRIGCKPEIASFTFKNLEDKIYFR